MTDVLAVDLLPDGLGATVLVFVLLAGLTAGFIDAVVGGGGLVQLPALLLVPGISPVEALATNKLGSVFGTTTNGLTPIITIACTGGDIVVSVSTSPSRTMSTDRGTAPFARSGRLSAPWSSTWSPHTPTLRANPPPRSRHL